MPIRPASQMRYHLRITTKWTARRRLTKHACIVAVNAPRATHDSITYLDTCACIHRKSPTNVKVRVLRYLPYLKLPNAKTIGKKKHVACQAFVPLRDSILEKHTVRVLIHFLKVCTKAFARADLLKRHSLGHNKDDPQSKPSIVQHSRVSQACEACAGLHLKCEEEKPCKRCSKKGIQCNYTPSFLPNDMHQSPPQHSPVQDQHSQQVQNSYHQQQQQQQHYSENVNP